MSGGERNRVHLAKVLREGHNFLLLGEVELVGVMVFSFVALLGWYVCKPAPPPPLQPLPPGSQPQRAEPGKLKDLG